MKKLMEDFNNSPTRELEITTDGFHIHLSKNEAPFISQDNKNYADSPAIEASDESIVSSKNDDLDDASLIKSPMVGTVYLQPEPEKAAYVSVGSHVHKGDVPYLKPLTVDFFIVYNVKIHVCATINMIVYIHTISPPNLKTD